MKVAEVRVDWKLNECEECMSEKWEYGCVNGVTGLEGHDYKQVERLEATWIFVNLLGRVIIYYTKWRIGIIKA